MQVHTEAAYLSMDQVIASNNLTMAISAAFPAVTLTLTPEPILTLTLTPILTLNVILRRWR